jgi:hypothetical protein
MVHVTVGRLLRRALLVLTTVLLVVLAWAAISGAIDQLPRSLTLGQRLETAVQLALGALTLLVVLTCFRWRRFALPIRRAWAVSLAITATLSPLVWGPPMPLVALAFLALSLLVAAVVNRALSAGSAD